MKKKKLSGHFCVVAVAESCRLYRVELCLNWKHVTCDFPQGKLVGSYGESLQILTLSRNPKALGVFPDTRNQSTRM